MDILYHQTDLELKWFSFLVRIKIRRFRILVAKAQAWQTEDDFGAKFQILFDGQNSQA